MTCKLGDGGQFVDYFGFAALLAFIGLFYCAISNAGDTGQDMVGLAVAVLAAEEDVGSEDWNGHGIRSRSRQHLPRNHKKEL